MYVLPCLVMLSILCFLSTLDIRTAVCDPQHGYVPYLSNTCYMWLLFWFGLYASLYVTFECCMFYSFLAYSIHTLYMKLIVTLGFIYESQTIIRIQEVHLERGRSLEVRHESLVEDSGEHGDSFCLYIFSFGWLYINSYFWKIYSDDYILTLGAIYFC